MTGFLFFLLPNKFFAHSFCACPIKPRHAPFARVYKPGNLIFRHAKKCLLTDLSHPFMAAVVVFVYANACFLSE